MLFSLPPLAHLFPVSYTALHLVGYIVSHGCLVFPFSLPLPGRLLAHQYSALDLGVIGWLIGNVSPMARAHETGLVGDILTIIKARVTDGHIN